MKGTKILTLLLSLILLVSISYSQESFKLAFDSEELDVCQGELKDFNLYIKNDGTFLSDYLVKESSEKKMLKIKNSFLTLEPGESDAVPFSVFANSNFGTYDLSITTYTALGKSLTKEFKLNINDCEMDEKLQIEKIYDIYSCEDNEAVSFKVNNLEAKKIDVKFDVSFAFETRYSNLSIDNFGTKNAVFNFDVPCDAKGKGYMYLMVDYDGKIFPKKINLNAMTKPDFVVSVKNELHYCGYGEVLMPVSIKNIDNEDNTYTLKENGPLFISVDKREFKIEEGKTVKVPLKLKPFLFGDKNYTMNLTIESSTGAIMNKEIFLSTYKKITCEEPVVFLTKDMYNVKVGQNLRIPIKVEYDKLKYLDTPKNFTYSISGDKYNFLNYTVDEISVENGKDATFYINVKPHSKLKSGNYTIPMEIKSKNSETKLNLRLNIDNGNNGTIFNMDNIGYGFKNNSAMLFGLVFLLLLLVILIVLVVIKSSRDSDKNSVAKKNTNEITVDEKSLHKEFPKIKSEVSLVKDVDDIVDSKRLEEEAREEKRRLQNLLGTIEVEKNARKKVIDDLKEWSRNYDELKKSKDRDEKNKQKNLNVLKKEKDEILGLLRVQEDSFDQLSKREKQIKKRLDDTEKKSFFEKVKDFFKSEKYVELDEVEKKTKSKKASKKPKKVVTKKKVTKNK